MNYLPFRRSGYAKDTGQAPNRPRNPVNHFEILTYISGYMTSIYLRVLSLLQINRVSSWIDGSSIYGQSQVWANCLRAFGGGQLRTSDVTHKFPALNKLGLPFHNYPDGRQKTRSLEEMWSKKNY